jgi:hypothetical protein
MENYSSVKFYQKRDFGDNLNAGFTFIRENFKPLFKTVVSVAGPFGLLSIIFTLFWTSSIYDGIETMETTASESPFAAVASFFGGSFFLYFLSSLAFSLFGFLSVVGYVKLHFQNKELPVATADIWRECLSHVGALLLVGILFYLGMVVGFIFLLIPGIFLAVYWSLAPYLTVLENKGLSAFGRSAELLRGNWWRTFAYLLVVIIIAVVVSLVFALPGSILGATAGLFATSETEALQSVGAFSWVNIVSVLISSIGTLFSYILFAVPVAFYIGSLIEEKESRGLMAEIEAEENAQPKQDEGEY